MMLTYGNEWSSSNSKLHFMDESSIWPYTAHKIQGKSCHFCNICASANDIVYARSEDVKTSVSVRFYERFLSFRALRVMGKFTSSRFFLAEDRSLQQCISKTCVLSQFTQPSAPGRL